MSSVVQTVNKEVKNIHVAYWRIKTMENSKTVIQISGSRLNHVMSNTVDMTQVEKYFSQLVLADKLSRLDGMVREELYV